MMLATFLGRFWSAPGRLGLPFPVDRRALSGHRDLALSEGRVRGAIKLLEEIGFLEREEPEPGRRYQPTVEGLHRRPLVYRFAPEYRALLTAANRTPRRGPGKAQDGRRALAAAPPSCLPGPRGRPGARQNHALARPKAPLRRQPLSLWVR